MSLIELVTSFKRGEEAPIQLATSCKCACKGHFQGSLTLGACNRCVSARILLH